MTEEERFVQLMRETVPSWPDHPQVRCPELELRAGMSDGEFWEHVLLLPQTDVSRYDPGYDEPALGPLTEPCSECGSVGACAWDAEGRPLIHPMTEEES